jgi:hypothetical protein
MMVKGRGDEDRKDRNYYIHPIIPYIHIASRMTKHRNALVRIVRNFSVLHRIRFLLLWYTRLLTAWK